MLTPDPLSLARGLSLQTRIGCMALPVRLYHRGSRRGGRNGGHNESAAHVHLRRRAGESSLAIAGGADEAPKSLRNN